MPKEKRVPHRQFSRVHGLPRLLEHADRDGAWTGSDWAAVLAGSSATLATEHFPAQKVLWEALDDLPGVFLSHRPLLALNL
ncbi:hypothetical protein AVEN_225401-1 [Araneus ventricosus]|uniref:Uncharacterized protein n=1 Tax=Araneus ventricosus TaxID=182803 RepID=A0A4Y2X8E9_ARAVE|nr:hypothetical protein AVEN_225401-1 [Araneus ventricosus]